MSQEPIWSDEEVDAMTLPFRKSAKDRQTAADEIVRNSEPRCSSCGAVIKPVPCPHCKKGRLSADNVGSGYTCVDCGWQGEVKQGCSHCGAQ
jgi:hypothetical protein